MSGSDDRATVTRADAAKALGVTTRQITNWQNADNHPFPVSIPGRPVRYDLADMIEWYVQREVKGRISHSPSGDDSETIDVDFERARKVQTERILNELEIEKQRRLSIPREFATAIVGQYAKEYRSSGDALPGQMRDEFPELNAKHFEFMRDLIAEMGNRLASIRIEWDDISEN